MKPPSSFQVVICDHDLMRDHYRHFLDASRRLTSAMGYVTNSSLPFDKRFIEDLDAAITDLMLARQALMDAIQGTAWTVQQPK